MAVTHGGVHEIGISDPDTSDTVHIQAIAEDYTIDTEAGLFGLADGQSARASTMKEITFFAINLTAAQETQLNTWDDNETPVQLLVAGLDYTISWADPSKLHVEPVPGAVVGELAGYTLNLQVER